MAKARKLKVARVKPDYFDKCEEEEKLVDRSAYLIKTEEDEEEEEEEEEEEVKPPKAKAKAADDSDTMQVDPKSKKRKADSLGDEEDDATTATAATSSTTTASAATKKAKTELTTVRSTRTSVPGGTATILTLVHLFPMCRARAVVMRPPRPTLTFKRRACGLAWPSKPTLTRALSCAFLPHMC